MIVIVVGPIIGLAYQPFVNIFQFLGFDKCFVQMFIFDVSIFTIFFTMLLLLFVIFVVAAAVVVLPMTINDYKSVKSGDLCKLC